MNAGKPTLYLTVIFLLGLATGGILGVTLTKQQLTKPVNLASIGDRVKQELTTTLDLDASQRQKLGPLVDTSLGRIQLIYDDMLVQISHVLKDGEDQFIPLLRPEQKAKLGRLARDRADFIRKHNPLDGN